MGFEFVITRLKGIRSRFVPDEAVERAADLQSAVLLLEDSVFAEEMARLRAGERGTVSPASVARCIEEGHQRVLTHTAALARQWLPQYAMLAFSRLELEQIKEALRQIHSPAHERRIKFLPLTPHSGWTAQWHPPGSVALFKSELEKIGHPFAAAINADAPQAEAEEQLEKYYFARFLPQYRKTAETAWDFFADQNDIANLHLCRLAGGNDAERHFIPGCGRLSPKEFRTLSALSETELANSLAKRLGRAVKSRPGLAGFAQSIRQAYLRRWRIRAILQPMGLWDLLVFLEETETMAANLKLAVLAGAGNAQEMSRYFVQRKIA